MSDIEKYLVSRETKDVVITLTDDDGTVDEFVVTIRPLPWSVKNRIVTGAAAFDSEGRTTYDGDKYLREALKYVIVKAPWGATNDLFLSRVGNKLGKALEGLVPSAFEGSVEATLPETKKE